MTFSLDPCPDCTRCDGDRCDATYCRLDHPTGCPWCAEDEAAIRDAIETADPDTWDDTAWWTRSSSWRTA